MQTTIIGVRFTKIGKIYHFDSSALPDVSVGEHVIVDTVRGKHLGEVIQKNRRPHPKAAGSPWIDAPPRAIFCSSNPGSPNRPKP